MESASKRRKREFYILIFVFAIALSAFVYSVSFTSNPTINNGEDVVYTINDLTCSWVALDSLETNVSWYNGTTLFRTNIIAGSNDILSNSLTSKNDLWTCQVKISNSTDVLFLNASISINNSAPTDVKVYYSDFEIQDPYSINEDEVYFFVFNSTDADFDALEYFFPGVPPSFCTMINYDTGAFTCTARHSDINATGNELITFTNASFQAMEKLGINRLSNTRTFTFSLIPVDDQAYFPDENVSNQLINSGINWSVTINAQDEELNYPLNFSVESDLGLVRIINLTNRTARVYLQSIPTNSDVGNWTITVNVTDSSGANITRSASQMTFELNINRTNSIPSITNIIQNQSSSQGNGFTIWFYGNDSDSIDTLTFNVSRNLLSSNCTSGMFNLTATTINNNNTNATGYINITNITNNDVACRNVNISIRDQSGGVGYQLIQLNITNANDAPIINEVGINGNISNQTSRLYETYVYKINATDIDQLTYDAAVSGVLTYYSNDSRFTPNLNTGIINITPTNETLYVGNWTINITVTDGNLNATRLMQLNISENNVPILNLSPNNRIILQNSDISLNFSVIELDNESVTMEFVSLTSFNDSIYNSSFSIITQDRNETNNMTYSLNLTIPENSSIKSDDLARNNLVGNHRLALTFKDVPAQSYDARSSGILNFTIENENDAPFFDMNQDNESDNITFGIIVKDREYSILIKATDFDIFLGALSDESLNLTVPVDSTNSATIARYNNSLNIFNLTINSNSSGEHSLTLNITDVDGLSSTQIINFTVNANSTAPIFENITPYFNSLINETIYSFTSALSYPSKITQIFIFENTSVLFDANVTNDSSVVNNYVDFRWYLDGELIKTVLNATPTVNSNSSFVYFNFFSSGIHNVTLTVQDKQEYISTWLWQVNVTNVNRPPEYCGNLENLTPPEFVINGTWSTPDNYLIRMDNVQRFYDPDDDLLNTGNVSLNCSTYNSYNSSLSYNLYNPQDCTMSTFTFINNGLTVVPSKTGSCFVQFTAIDSLGANTTSDVIVITFSGVEPSQGTETETRRSGGSSTRTQIITVPLIEEVDKPVPIKIISPGVVSTYVNKTIYIPLKIRNTWESEVRGVELSGVSLNASMPSEGEGVTIKLDRTFFPLLPIGGESDVMLELSNYRREGPFEIVIYAKVADPEFTDSVSIYIAGLEQTSKGDEIKSKVTFAKDMLSENPTCRELNELLDRAEIESSAENFDEALKLVDGVINGCKYLMKEEESRRETPSVIKQGFDISREYSLEIVLGAVALLVLTLLFYAIAALKRKISEK